ncbi:Origin recognition complex subunit 4 [Durusdinium trenchii]
MELCQKVLQVMKRVLGGESAESKSLLLLGEPGSGKTQAVDWCLQKLKEENNSIITLRARGDMYSSNIECLRHLAQQIAGQLMTSPQNGSFEGSMEWFRCILKESFNRESAVVIILDRFEHFCNMARQTLLYNLFNLAQDLSVRLCIVGVSEKFDVTCQLEKRILSRFSMEYLFAFLPRDAKDVTRILECKLQLPENADSLDVSFVQDFNQRITEALQARLPQWAEDIELGRKPTWFMWQCLPVVGFLRSSLVAPGLPKKRRELGEDAQRRRLFLRGLAECEHLVLLTLFRQRTAKWPRSLSTVLHELLRLVECNGKVLKGHTEESLSSAFYRLISYKLVNFIPVSSSDVSSRYRPCESQVDEEYRQWVEDMEKTESAMLQNPLKNMPEEVQQWVRTI